MAERKQSAKTTKDDQSYMSTPSTVNPELIKRSALAIDEAYTISIPLLLREDRIEAVRSFYYAHPDHSKYQSAMDQCTRLSSLIRHCKFLLQWGTYLEEQYAYVMLYRPPSLERVIVYTDPSYYNHSNGKLLWEWIVEQIRDMVKAAEEISST